MSQDVYAHAKLNMGKLDFNKQISTNVHGTSDVNDQNHLDTDIARLWHDLLIDVYSSTNPELQPPKINNWHRGMREIMKIGESGNHLIPFARHVAAKQGLVYPATPVADNIGTLQVPGNTSQDFEAIFQKALNNILELWGELALLLQNKISPLDTQVSWSMDTGIDERNNMIYWS
jgi:hypothetical protein